MILQILLYCVAFHFVMVSLNYFAFRWELRVREVSETDFDMTVKEMWIPFVNMNMLYLTLKMINKTLKKEREEKRKAENIPSFHERLFRVRKEFGKYHIKK